MIAIQIRHRKFNVIAAGKLKEALLNYPSIIHYVKYPFCRLSSGGNYRLTASCVVVDPASSKWLQLIYNIGYSENESTRQVQAITTELRVSSVCAHGHHIILG